MATVLRMVDLDRKGKRVLIREDLNVPVHDGVVTSDARIRASLATIGGAHVAGARGHAQNDNMGLGHGKVVSADPGIRLKASLSPNNTPIVGPVDARRSAEALGVGVNSSATVASRPLRKQRSHDEEHAWGDLLGRGTGDRRHPDRDCSQ